MKWLKCFLALCVLCVGQLVVASSSYAASVSDDVIKTGGTADVSVAYTAGGGVCGTGGPYSADLSTTWGSYVSDVSKYHSAYASQKPAVAAAFQSAVNASEGWALVQYTVQNNRNSPGGGSAVYGDNDKYLVLYVSDNPAAQFKSLYGGQQLSMTGSWYAVTIAYGQLGSSCSVGIMEIQHGTGSSLSFIQQAGYPAPEEKSISINFHIPYGSVEGGYGGEYADWEYTPPIPTTAPATGSVDCGFTKVQGISVHQNGETVTPTWDYEVGSGEYRATWQYDLTNNSYTVSVKCGPSSSTWTTISSSGADVTPYANNDWMCTDYCILS